MWPERRHKKIITVVWRKPGVGTSMWNLRARKQYHDTQRGVVEAALDEFVEG